MVPEVFARNAFSLAASITAFCEALSTFEDEKTFIWRGPMNWAKGMYLITRYSSLVVSVVNSFTLFYGPLRLYPTQPDHCLYWFSIFSALSVIPVVAIEAFSVTRIFLLYRPDRRVGVLAGSLVITEMLLVSISSSDAINSSSFTPECGMTTPRRFLAVLLWLVGTQLLLIGLTLYRIRSLFGDRRQGSTVCLVLQQGIALNGVLILTTAGALIPSLKSGVANLNVIALWPGLICSCAFCRVILHLRRSALLGHDTKNSPEARSTLDIEFTSWLTSPIEDSSSINRNVSDSVLVRRRLCPRTNASNEHSQPADTPQPVRSRPPSHILSPVLLESA